MSNHCSICGKKLSFFQSQILSETICAECKDKQAQDTARQIVEDKTQLENIRNEIVTTNSINNPQLELLKKRNKQDIISLYSQIYDSFHADGELTEQELKTLADIQNSLNLTKEEIQYNQKVLPYIYKLD